MRIGLVSSLAAGGPVEQAITLTQALVDEGDEVRVACATAELARRFAGAGARPRVLPLRHQLDLAGAVRVWRAMEGVDVVHAQDRRSGLWVRAGPRPRRSGARIYTVHGLPDPYLPVPVVSRGPRWHQRLAYEGVEVALCRRVDFVIVPSQAVAQVLTSRLGYPKHRLRVVPNGVAPSPVCEGASDGAPERAPETVGCVSVLDPVKGLDVFVRAAALLAAERPATRFIIFGEGPQRQALEALVNELRLGDRLELAGHVPQRLAFASLDVFALPSHMENSPMALLEAMEAGVPAVATRVGGIPEITGEDGGTLVPPGDPVALAAGIGRLLDDTAHRLRQAAAARKRVADHHTARANARATRAVYEEARSRRQV